MIKVGFKFCGNCNPHISTGDIYKSILARINNLKNVNITDCKYPEIDILVVISGCPTDCAERKSKDIVEFIVAGETYNHNPCNKENLSTLVINDLYDFTAKHRGHFR